MDTAVNFTVFVSRRERPVSPRRVAAEAVEQFERLDSVCTCCSEIVRGLEVTDSTLRHWLCTRARRMKDSQWPGQTVRFFESPTGLSVLYRMITAAHLFFVQANDGGIRNLCAFLKLSGLDEFIASGYGTQQAVARQMESLLIAFGEQEDQRLAAGMPPREISAAVDETFHPDICLVRMEPVSDFILLKVYQPRRDADTWNRCLVAKLEQALQQAHAEEAAAGEHLSGCRDRQQHATEAWQGLSHDYHAFDLDNGQPLDENEVGRQQTGHFDTLQQIAAEARLSARATKELAKARRELILALYLARVAEKASDAAERYGLRRLSQETLARARSPDDFWGTLRPEVQAELERKTQICADLFQRSNSCVEGRNGQLSLKHHALHRFTLRKLQTLTVLHNYLIRRPDGTTAAERVHGTASRDLFGWLLDRLSIPARPRTRRRTA